MKSASVQEAADVEQFWIMGELTKQTPERGRWGPAAMHQIAVRYLQVNAALLLVGITLWALWPGDSAAASAAAGPNSSIRPWAALRWVWMLCAALAPYAWIAYRRYRYNEDVIWWYPPIMYRSACIWGLPGLIVVVEVPRALNNVVGAPDGIMTILLFLAFVIVAIVKTVSLNRRLRSMSEPHCCNCLHNVNHGNPFSDMCAECGFPVSESINRWKVCPEAFRPEWVTEVEGWGSATQPRQE